MSKWLFSNYKNNSLHLFAFIACVFFIFFIMNPDVIVDLRTFSFDDGTYSHAYIVPFIIIYLYWRAAQLNQLHPRFNFSFFLLFVASLFVFLWFQFAQLTNFSRLMWPLMLNFAFLSCFKFNYSIIVPVSLLWFITPIWGVVNGILQFISVTVVTEMMHLTTIPVFIEGNMVNIPSGTLEIAAGCSGLRYVIVSVILSILFSFLYLKRTKHILMFFALALLGSMITNWIRIFALILIGHYTEMQSSLMADHNMFGWFIYVPFIFLLFSIGGKFERENVENESLPSTQLTDNRLNRLSYVVLLVVFVFSGYTANVLIDKNFSYSIDEVALNFTDETAIGYLSKPIAPAIFKYESLSEKILEIESVSIMYKKYDFSGSELGAYSDFYLNNVTPRGWMTLKTTTFDGYQILVLGDNLGNHAAVMFWHEVGGNKAHSKRQILLYRLRQSLLFDRKSELHWLFAECKNVSCAEETKSLISMM